MSARKQMIDEADAAVKSGARLKVACAAIGTSIRTIQRWRKDLRDDGRKYNRITNGNAMTTEERKTVLDVACSPPFRDLSPNQIVPILAENDLYVGSESTFYRFLKQAGLLTHRSKAKAPQRHRPYEITATAPNQVWTWDITLCLTLSRGVYLYLYLILDIWDRSIVGWAVHDVQSGPFAADLLKETCLRQRVRRDEL